MKAEVTSYLVRNAGKLHLELKAAHPPELPKGAAIPLTLLQHLCSHAPLGAAQCCLKNSWALKQDQRLLDDTEVSFWKASQLRCTAQK